jgi:hypothetical protein
MADLLAEWIGDSRRRALHVGFAFGATITTLVAAAIFLLFA